MEHNTAYPSRNFVHPVIEKLMSVLGLTKAQANWAFKISKKQAIWVGNQIKKNPGLYPKGRGELKKIINWKKKNPAVNLAEYKYPKLLRLTLDNGKTTFFKDHGSLQNDKVFAICTGSQYKWVELVDASDCVEEGEYMSHCLKDQYDNYIGNGEKIFSLRDAYNKPIITLQLVEADDDFEYGKYKIEQYVESHDNAPSTKYAKYFKFLEEKLNKKRIKVSVFSKWQNDIITKFTKKDLTFKYDLEITSDNDYLVHNGMTVNGVLTFNHADSELPKNLIVGKDLILGQDCDAYTIPNGTIIGRNLFIQTSSISEIDTKKFKLGGKIIFEQ